MWALLLVGLVYLAAGADVDGEATVEEVCTGHMSSFYISVFVYGAPPANLSLNCCHCLFIYVSGHIQTSQLPQPCELC